MYRAVAFAVERAGADAGDRASVCRILDGVDVGIAHEPLTSLQIVYLNGEDISKLLRTPKISMGASLVSAIPEVRAKMVTLQREIAGIQDVIMDGRDIGTYVFPGAEKKYFLTASPETRAMRRWLELKSKGMEMSLEGCLNDLNLRDKNDSSRAFAPLARANDAILVDSDGKTIEEVVEFIYSDITKTLPR
jgi:cytidylate kinase